VIATRDEKGLSNETTRNPLDSDRRSHGRSLHSLTPFRDHPNTTELQDRQMNFGTLGSEIIMGWL
jgi:hypothetical protein